MPIKARLITIFFNQQNIKKLRKMVNDVGHNPNGWIDVTFIPESDKSEKESPPMLEVVEMRWEESGERAVIARSVKYEAQLLE
jgi:hypothetical protein